MKIVSCVDGFADFIQATALGRALRHQHREILLNAGSHLEFSKARAYFEHIDLLTPEVQLELGKNPQNPPFGELLMRLERAFRELRPDLVIVRGDSDAALAEALAAARQLIPVARLGAGVRANAKRRPSELNNVLADRLADVLFCDTQTAAQRLAEEGILSGVHVSGDVMLDVVQQQLPLARQRSSILQRVGLCPGYYLLAVLRSTAPLQEPREVHSVIKAFNSIREPIIFPVSLAQRTVFERLDLTLAPHVLTIDPLDYLDMLNLKASARAVITDVESVQREAYSLGVPCITLRDETEVPETVLAGWNRLVGSEAARIVDAVHDFLPPAEHPLLFGDGRAAEQIAAVLSSRPIVFGQNYDRVSEPLLARVAIS